MGEGGAEPEEGATACDRGRLRTPGVRARADRPRTLAAAPCLALRAGSVPLGVTGTGGLARGGREECLTVFRGRFLCRCEGKMFTA